MRELKQYVKIYFISHNSLRKKYSLHPQRLEELAHGSNQIIQFSANVMNNFSHRNSSIIFNSTTAFRYFVEIQSFRIK